VQVEPADHAIGRSRGGVTTKSHALVDGQGRAMVVLVGAGQAGDCPMLPVLLDELCVDRIGPGRPRTTPDALRGDKAYSSRAQRAMLRSRGIKAVIPERADQIANRKRKGSTGGRPVSFDAADYKNRNVIERFFNRIKHWRGIATRYDKHAVVYRGGIVVAAILDWLR
jgi:transposase